MAFQAHSTKDGRQHSLQEHLWATASYAERFADAFGARDLGRIAGLLHDLGKTSERFQRYLQGIGESGGDHKTGGCLYAVKLGIAPPVSFAIAGHHGGLPAPYELKPRLRETLSLELARAADRLYSAEGTLPAAELPPWLSQKAPLEAELLTRMLFSALVDADYLDTEGHFHPEKHELRGQYSSLCTLLSRFDHCYRQRFAASLPSQVNDMRGEVFSNCLAAAEEAQGAFSLTVPTGGGKTLSSLAFALHHAAKWRLDRVIVVIPYTSIIEQTADVYRDFLGQDDVIEHHSGVTASCDDDSQWRHQLAAENWDAPVVVTTAVQFFESLFANTPGKCRKLHNLARSVVIIDETQTLPLGLLKPTFELLAELVRHYSVTCLLTTATQPAYAKFTDLPIREIMPDPAALAQRLKRVRYRRPTKALSWTEVAEHMGGSGQAMAVLNTRADARALFDTLPEESRLHLSTNLCGAHRREVLAEVRRRLSEGEPCLLATTQLVEAGVDLDFPLVMRAMGPLERIVQAAGRCNREGRLCSGETLVFQPKEGGLPPGSYETATMATEAFLQNELDADLDFDSPDLHHRYFNLLYGANDLDAKGITALRRSLDFPAVAEAYRIIEDDSVSVAVPWGDGAALLDGIERVGETTRDDFRALQPYFVNLRKHELQRAQAQRLCREVILGSGLWRWEGRYDDDLGLQWEFDVRII